MSASNLQDIKPVKVRTLADYTEFLFRFLPVGRLWDVFNETFNDLFEAFAEEFNRNDQRNIDLQKEAIPGLATETLEQWEFDVLLPDELPDETVTISERQARICTKLFNTPNNPTAQFFENFALDRGVVIAISFAAGAFRVGINRVGDRLQGTYNNFIWVVDYVSGPETEYIALEATFRRLAPAWQTLIFNAPP